VGFFIIAIVLVTAEWLVHRNLKNCVFVSGFYLLAYTYLTYRIARVYFNIIEYQVGHLATTVLDVVIMVFLILYTLDAISLKFRGKQFGSLNEYTLIFILFSIVTVYNVNIAFMIVNGVPIIIISTMIHVYLFLIWVSIFIISMIFFTIRNIQRMGIEPA